MMIMACMVNVVNMTAVYNNRDFIQHDVSLIVRACFNHFRILTLILTLLRGNADLASNIALHAFPPRTVGTRYISRC